MTAPRGISSLHDGKGDCRILLPGSVKPCSLEKSESAVPGGVGSQGSAVEADGALFTDDVRRCRVKYEADRGSSGLGDVGRSFDRPAVVYEDRRLATGEC